MPKRKLKQNRQLSDDEMESPRPEKQLKKQNSIPMINMPSTSTQCDFSMDGDDSNSTDISCATSIDSSFNTFTNFLKAFSFNVEDDNKDETIDFPQNLPNESEYSINDFEKTRTKVVPSSSSSYENYLESKIRIVPVPTKLSEIVFLEHPESLTLLGYVEVFVLLGRVSIFGYKLKEEKSVKVFSTEGTGLKKVEALNSAHKKSLKCLKIKIQSIACLEKNIDINELLDCVGSNTVVFMVTQIPLPPPLRVLSLYYPDALQTRWPRSKKVQKNKKFELSSTEESYAIDISDDFKMLSEEVTQIMSQSVLAEQKIGTRIIVLGEQNSGKSTLIRYLMNSALEKHPMFYFLDTDLGQTEYTPPGVVSLFRVTKPLLGPPFAHQKKAIKMIFVGSLSPATSPELFKTSVMCLMKYFNANFPNETLFVNTNGWCKGVGGACIQSVRDIVKPTVVIRLVSPELNSSLEREFTEDRVTNFYIPSKAPSLESGASYYNAKQLRDFSVMSYFGQCQKPHLPISRMNSFRPYCISWHKVALYVMWAKVIPDRLIESIHGSVVALCHVHLSYVLKSDNPELPLTLRNDPVCECLGFGLVRASDETNHLFYIVTPLKMDELQKVNAIVRGDVVVPSNILLKQDVKEVTLPFTNDSNMVKTPGLKSVPKRAFRNTLTPAKKKK